MIEFAGEHGLQGRWGGDLAGVCAGRSQHGGGEDRNPGDRHETRPATGGADVRQPRLCVPALDGPRDQPTRRADVFQDVCVEFDDVV